VVLSQTVFLAKPLRRKGGSLANGFSRKAAKTQRWFSGKVAKIFLVSLRLGEHFFGAKVFLGGFAAWRALFWRKVFLAAWRLGENLFFQKEKLQLVHDTGNAVFDEFLIEIDEQAKLQTSYFEVGKQLFGMNRGDSLDGFDLNDDLLLHDEIGPEAHIHFKLIPKDRNDLLFVHPQTSFSQFVVHDFLINRLEQSWPKLQMNAIGNIDDDPGNFVFVHWPRGLVLRRIVSQHHDFFSQTGFLANWVSRKDAKTQRWFSGKVAKISLVSLRLCEHFLAQGFLWRLSGLASSLFSNLASNT
jgi:hypothetical protein